MIGSGGQSRGMRGSECTLEIVANSDDCYVVGTAQKGCAYYRSKGAIGHPGDPEAKLLTEPNTYNAIFMTEPFEINRASSPSPCGSEPERYTLTLVSFLDISELRGNRFPTKPNPS